MLPITGILDVVAICGFAGLLAVAALTDVTTLRVPNLTRAQCVVRRHLPALSALCSERRGGRRLVLVAGPGHHRICRSIGAVLV